MNDLNLETDPLNEIPLNFKSLQAYYDRNCHRLCHLQQVDYDKEGVLRKVEHVDMFTSSCLWDQNFGEPVLVGDFEDLTAAHSYGAPVFFKPSIAEVFRQIPLKIASQYSYFLVQSDGFTAKHERHKSIVRLFKRA